MIIYILIIEHNNKIFYVLAGRPAIDNWWWPFWGWGVFCMANAKPNKL